ncbi:hypothetical protein A7P53_13340 [Acinetobacter defluvii]|uniref:hypothetical protein n=1 Tax=Acinetobacter defluvii TaxID=1871111 RepID=UPI001490706B|nr:hypothetical protein [Acinetobacter defluvii]NNP73531.1 hypothetical protein [Acinetobacter defluvii]
MATYELYLWEPEVDLSNQAWNDALRHLDHDDPDTMQMVIRQKIYKLYKDKEHPAPHIEKFFSCIIQTLNKPEYAVYFEGMSDWIMEQQGYFNNSPCLVFEDENTLANADSGEFKRALYEAIDQSGVCAYGTMDGYLIPSDPIARKHIFNTILNSYPELTAQAPSVPVTLDSTPQNVTEMKDIVLAFMQQHPVGRQFEVEKINKEFDARGQYYCIYFKKELEKLTQYFNVSFDYDKRGEYFDLRIAYNGFSFIKLFLSQEEEVLLKNNEFSIKSYPIKNNSFNMSLWSKNLSSLDNYPERKKLEHFILEKNEMNLFSLFLEQLNISLNTYSSITDIHDLAELVFHPKGIFYKDLELVEKGGVVDRVNVGLINSLYKLSMYTKIDEKYKKTLDKVFTNFNENRVDNQERFKVIEETKRVIMEYVKNKS